MVISVWFSWALDPYSLTLDLVWLQYMSYNSQMNKYKRWMVLVVF